MFEEYWFWILVLTFIFGVIVGLLIPIWKELKENWKRYLSLPFLLWALITPIYVYITNGVSYGSELSLYFAQGLFVGWFLIFIFSKVSKKNQSIYVEYWVLLHIL